MSVKSQRWRTVCTKARLLAGAFLPIVCICVLAGSICIGASPHKRNRRDVAALTIVGEQSAEVSGSIVAKLTKVNQVNVTFCLQPVVKTTLDCPLENGRGNNTITWYPPDNASKRRVEAGEIGNVTISSTADVVDKKMTVTYQGGLLNTSQFTDVFVCADKNISPEKFAAVQLRMHMLDCEKRTTSARESQASQGEKKSGNRLRADSVVIVTLLATVLVVFLSYLRWQDYVEETKEDYMRQLPSVSQSRNALRKARRSPLGGWRLKPSYEYTPSAPVAWN